MIDKYHSKAKENKIKIINSCGFDSIPSDMGVFYSQKNLFEKTGKKLEWEIKIVGEK